MSRPLICDLCGSEITDQTYVHVETYGITRSLFTMHTGNLERDFHDACFDKLRGIVSAHDRGGTEVPHTCST